MSQIIVPYNPSEIPRCKFTTIFLATASAFAFSFWPQTLRAEATCELKAVTCGSFNATFAGVEGCTFVKLGSTGNVDPPIGVEITAFVGVRVQGNVLFIGGASFEKSLRLKCVFGPKDKHPSKEQMKRALKEILEKNPEIKRKYPYIKRIELDKNFRFHSVTPEKFKQMERAFKEDR